MSTEIDPWIAAELGPAVTHTYRVVGVADGRYVYLHRGYDLDEARALLERYRDRAGNPSACFRIMRTTSSITEDWLDD